MNRKIGCILTLVAAGICTAIGLGLGQNQEVLMKAINICLECVGIG